MCSETCSLLPCFVLRSGGQPLHATGSLSVPSVEGIGWILDPRVHHVSGGETGGNPQYHGGEGANAVAQQRKRWEPLPVTPWCCGVCCRNSVVEGSEQPCVSVGSPVNGNQETIAVPVMSPPPWLRPHGMTHHWSETA